MGIRILRACDWVRGVLIGPGILRCVVKGERRRRWVVRRKEGQDGGSARVMVMSEETNRPAWAGKQE